MCGFFSKSSSGSSFMQTLFSSLVKRLHKVYRKAEA
ncbi:hypothetical protein J838_3432, partial [Acinetobacter baumannii 25935_5]